MKCIKTTEAVGHVLCHDITQIIPGVTKGAVFTKGHVVREEDIPVLLSVGKETLYVWEKQEGMLHENEAADILREICQGANMHPSGVKEGKIELIADCDGLFRVNRAGLRAVNSLGEMMIACRHGNFPVKRGDKLAGTRIIPLVIEEEKMERAREVAGPDPLFQVLPYQKRRAGIVTTGSEVYYGRIQDQFTPVLEAKLREFPVDIVGHEITNDDAAMTTAAIEKLLAQGADLILCTGGMSVDPDDRTPLAIRNTGAEIVSYGSPVLPGAMFLLSYLGEERIPILGLPGCVMYSKRTIFDLVLPRVMAGVEITREDLDGLGEGGFCLNCPVCTFPNCGFGKGH
ncbi:MAG: molybdopterin-binding protein [Clostridiales bacterium]|nr:molybdopterin-binding protein [Clostridiales bacterium]